MIICSVPPRSVRRAMDAMVAMEQLQTTESPTPLMGTMQASIAKRWGLESPTTDSVNGMTALGNKTTAFARFFAWLDKIIAKFVDFISRVFSGLGKIKKRLLKLESQLKAYVPSGKDIALTKEQTLATSIDGSSRAAVAIEYLDEIAVGFNAIDHLAEFTLSEDMTPDAVAKFTGRMVTRPIAKEVLKEYGGRREDLGRSMIPLPGECYLFIVNFNITGHMVASIKALRLPQDEKAPATWHATDMKDGAAVYAIMTRAIKELESSIKDAEKRTQRIRDYNKEIGKVGDAVYQEEKRSNIKLDQMKRIRIWASSGAYVVEREFRRTAIKLMSNVLDIYEHASKTASTPATESLDQEVGPILEPLDSGCQEIDDVSCAIDRCSDNMDKDSCMEDQHLAEIGTLAASGALDDHPSDATKQLAGIALESYYRRWGVKSVGLENSAPDNNPELRSAAVDSATHARATFIRNLKQRLKNWIMRLKDAALELFHRYTNVGVRLKKEIEKLRKHPNVDKLVARDIEVPEKISHRFVIDGKFDIERCTKLASKGLTMLSKMTQDVKSYVDEVGQHRFVELKREGVSDVDRKADGRKIRNIIEHELGLSPVSNAMNHDIPIDAKDVEAYALPGNQYVIAYIDQLGTGMKAVEGERNLNLKPMMSDVIPIPADMLDAAEKAATALNDRVMNFRKNSIARERLLEDLMLDLSGEVDVISNINKLGKASESGEIDGAILSTAFTTATVVCQMAKRRISNAETTEKAMFATVRICATGLVALAEFGLKHPAAASNSTGMVSTATV